MATAQAGDRFGRLVLLEEAERDKWGKRRWRCRCDCGGEVILVLGSLKAGLTKSCGCLSDEVRRARTGTANPQYRHGMDATPTYRTWRAMKNRCTNPKADSYGRYGGRGVSVCERWLTFANFLADMGERPEGKTLDRVDPDGNYEPANCRWATPREQRHNWGKDAKRKAVA